MEKPDFRMERKLLKRDVWPVAGVDEAGRGPLAGPVAAAAVILDPHNLPRGLNDSKLLTAEERESLYEAIMARALAVAVGFSSAAEIDAVNIRQATFRAMRRALAALASPPRYVLIDGNDLAPGLCCEAETIVKGDGAILSIAAASIVAKVTRDRLMRRLCAVHPVYGFSRHAGYATPAHLAAIEAHGPCPFHRMSFSPFRAAPEPRAD
ncbi:ribonuclease HII [Methylocella tundrae]|uniref:Ribonuclease HII n=1 Tax=Methylocella tundrae TaxID=227605 RepID=A0A4V6IN28_METTU|nr:ribonuclease HII [Methylocella tundrae]WPP04166.1 ribonuclease HII [Methylocella tundrae]VFU10438.1 ribonuclease HII, degrades RNA of DNA-RNA hybrids [Methylocella tundrae]